MTLPPMAIIIKMTVGCWDLNAHVGMDLLAFERILPILSTASSNDAARITATDQKNPSPEVSLGTLKSRIKVF